MADRRMTVSEFSESLQARPGASIPAQQPQLQLTDDQKIAQIGLAVIPTLLGAAFGGARGGQIGAQAGQVGTRIFETEKKERAKAQELAQQRSIELARGERKETREQQRLEILQARSRRDIGGEELARKKTRGEIAFKAAQLKKLTVAEKRQEATLATNLENLDDIITKLSPRRDPKTKKITSPPRVNTGPVVGAVPEFIRKVTNPELEDIRNRLVGIVFQSLKATLGGQFTQREALELVNSEFNISLPNEFNVSRLERMKNKILNVVGDPVAAQKLLAEAKVAREQPIAQPPGGGFSTLPEAQADSIKLPEEMSDDELRRELGQ